MVMHSFPNSMNTTVSLNSHFLILIDVPLQGCYSEKSNKVSKYYHKTNSSKYMKLSIDQYFNFADIPSCSYCWTGLQMDQR